MKNKQLFIMALLMIAGGINALESTDDMSGINGITNQSSYTDRSLLWMVCSSESFKSNQDCKLVNSELMRALQFNDLKQSIAKAKKTVSELGYDGLLIENQLPDMNDRSEYAEGSFGRTLPEERLTEFENAFDRLLTQKPAGVSADNIKFGKKRDTAKVNALFGKK